MLILTCALLASAVLLRRMPLMALAVTLAGLAATSLVGHPGNPRGCETWEDAGSWWHSGSIRRSCVNAR